MNLTKGRKKVRGVRQLGLAAACVAMAMAAGASPITSRVELPATQGDAGGPAGTHGPVRVSGGVMAGNVLTKVNPVYPQEAREGKIQGAIVLSAVIGKDGAVENLQAISGPEVLRAPSLDAVRQWTYKPYLLNGRPVEVQTTITVTYSLEQ